MYSSQRVKQTQNGNLRVRIAPYFARASISRMCVTKLPRCNLGVIKICMLPIIKEKSRSTIPDMPQKSPIDGGSYTRVIVTVPFRGALHFTVPLCSDLVIVYIPSCLYM